MRTDPALVVAGAEVLAKLEAEKLARVPAGRYPGTFASDPLCKLQEDQARRGFLGANIVESIYGYSVRYDSGLQEWALIASSRHGDVDGTLEDAVRAARAWAAKDPARRYVLCRDADRAALAALQVAS